MLPGSGMAGDAGMLAQRMTAMDARSASFSLGAVDGSFVAVAQWGPSPDVQGQGSYGFGMAGDTVCLTQGTKAKYARPTSFTYEQPTARPAQQPAEGISSGSPAYGSQQGMSSGGVYSSSQPGMAGPAGSYAGLHSGASCVIYVMAWPVALVGKNDVFPSASDDWLQQRPKPRQELQALTGLQVHLCLL